MNILKIISNLIFYIILSFAFFTGFTTAYGDDEDADLSEEGTYERWKEAKEQMEGRNYFKEITDISKPKLLERRRDKDKWDNAGRFVGQIFNNPEKGFLMTITREIRTTEKTEVVFKKLFSGELEAYETPYLKPGKYIIVLEAPVYRKKEIKDARIKSHYDTLIDIGFGTEEFDKN
jgi:hypothetical protein